MIPTEVNEGTKVRLFSGRNGEPLNPHLMYKINRNDFGKTWEHSDGHYLVYFSIVMLAGDVPAGAWYMEHTEVIEDDDDTD